MNIIDEYIGQFSGDVKERLNIIRNIIRSAAPEALEKISWDMPTFMQNGILIQFAAFKNHISLFPGRSACEAFKDEFTGYITSGKGTIQFQNNEIIPYDLIRRIVEFKISENKSKKQ